MAALLLSAGLAGEDFWAPKVKLWPWLTLLVAAGVFQQSLGLKIDTAIAENRDYTERVVWISIASILQLGEFVLVGWVGKPPSALLAVYTVGWALFGVHCTFHSAFTGPNTEKLTGFAVRYRSRRWVEAIYSCLGWAAKIGVVATELEHLLYNQYTNVVGLVSLGVMLISLGLTAWFAHP